MTESEQYDELLKLAERLNEVPPDDAYLLIRTLEVLAGKRGP